MRWLRFGKHRGNATQAETRSPSSDAGAPDAASTATQSPHTTPIKRLLNITRILAADSDLLLDQLKLHSQLAGLEWQKEKRYLALTALAALLGFACFLCLMIFIGVLVMMLSWNSDYRLLAAGVLCIFYALATLAAGLWLLKLTNRPEGAFPATRAELAADLALIRSKLE